MKFTNQTRLKAGALQLTVFIAVIIALLLAGIVLLSYTHRYLTEQSKAIVDNIRLADTGITYALKENVTEGDTIAVSIPDANEHQLLKLHISHWGIFDNAYVETIHRKKKFKRFALIGTVTTADRPALYLQDTQKPLALVGNTLIEGKSYLPEQGVKSGNIAGNNYYRHTFIQGTVQKSDTSLPALSRTYVKDLRFYLDNYIPEDENFINIRSNKKIINSFGNATKGFFSNDEIFLNNVTISGNIIIRSESKITIAPGAVLNNVILAAPEIHVQDGTHGAFQAIADKSVTIGKNCQLGYPTAIVLINNPVTTSNLPATLEKKIDIRENTTINGSICYFSDLSSNFNVNIYISANATIKGEIYCMGNLELAGSVTGTVYTKHFIVNNSGSVFVNHLFNSTISARTLPEQFGGIIFKGETKNVVKWLY